MMNQGLTSAEVNVFFDLVSKANDEQVKHLRAALEGEQRKRALLSNKGVQ